MNFTIIDRQNWKRKEYFEHYLSNVPCTYSMTVNLDITTLLMAIKGRALKLYPVMIYGISAIVNKHEEFRMSMDGSGNIGFFDEVNPSYTIFHKDDETFSDVWTTYSSDFEIFYERYLEDIQLYGNVKGMIGKPIQDNNSFTISCIPWVNFTSFNLNLEKGYNYLPPIFTLGQYHRENSQIVIPLSIQVHHAVCDGFHVTRFTNELQEWISSFL